MSFLASRALRQTPRAALALRAAETKPFATRATAPCLTTIASRANASSLVGARSTRARLVPAPRISRPAGVRWTSDQQDSASRSPPLREWGFEDITASLPSESSESSSSPDSTPQKNLILIDVREPIELTSTGIIPSAVAVPLASQPDAFFLTPEEFETRFGFPKPGAEEPGDMVFYCKAGVRARTAANLAVQAGYDPERIGVYDGSWLDWADRGGKVEKWEGEDLD